MVKVPPGFVITKVIHRSNGECMVYFENPRTTEYQGYLLAPGQTITIEEQG